MDIHKTIRQLLDERERLGRMIARLEKTLVADSPPPKRRGRKSMSPEERLKVSKRMQAYWAARRARE